MSFREKTAWVTLCAILLVLLMFWLHSAAPFHAMVASVLAYLLLQIVGSVVLRLRSPQDARQPQDEREHLIKLKATRVAYLVLVSGVLGGIFFPMHVLGKGPLLAVWLVFGAFVLAEAAKQAALIYYYRRGI
jgi:archaellum biogenesis protein FlaJ (TadC family)